MTINEESTKHDIADIIAGELQVSRATAYDMMREVLREVDTNKTPYDDLQETTKTAQSKVDHVMGCFDAAYVEGLEEALMQTSDERLKDLVERRLLWALYACRP